MSDRAEPRMDGRASRTQRSRAAICDACLDLIQEGVLQPSADQIAERSGLSRRSVFNHFKDLGELYDAVLLAGLQRYEPFHVEVGTDAAIGQRLELWMTARARFLEATSPFTQALMAQALHPPTGRQALRTSQEALALQQRDLERVFADEIARMPEAERAEIVEAIATASCPLAWEHLRHNRSLSVARARAVMLRSVTALLAASGSSGE
jgi:AcrR family transcriptional regulator